MMRGRWHVRSRLGFALLVTLALLFVAGPLLAGVDGDAQVLANRNSGPSLGSPFGTDQLGRDLFVRICNGGRRSLETAAVAGVVALVVGGTVGAVAALVRSLDGVLAQGIDLVVSVAHLPVILVLAPWFVSIPGGLGLLFGLASWDRVARIVRAETKSLLSSSILLAAVVSGGTKLSIVRRYLWPRLSGVVAAEVLLVMAVSASLEATLGFLQFGSADSLGVILHDAKGSVVQQSSRVLIPAALLVLIVTSLYLISRSIVQQRPVDGLARRQ